MERQSCGSLTRRVNVVLLLVMVELQQLLLLLLYLRELTLNWDRLWSC